MNILVIGNGFDLAHGLPTKYTHFLDFCKKLEKGELRGEAYMREIHELLFSSERPNFWYILFQEDASRRRGQWVDFEKIISRVIQELEKDLKWSHPDRQVALDSKPISLSNALLYAIYMIEDRFSQELLVKPDKDIKTYAEIRDELLDDLKRLCHALELYLYYHVMQTEVRFYSPDIETMQIDHILSFNYTDTFFKVYHKHKKADCDYIHGFADGRRGIAENNMVLGIDEYLQGAEKDDNTTFLRFKKFYQRISNHREFKYREWCAEIRQESEYESLSKDFLIKDQAQLELIESDQQHTWENLEKLQRKYMDDFHEKHVRHNICFFGHSMDVTDKDILRELLLNDNVLCTVYYHAEYDGDKRDLDNKIENLNKVIGQDELRKRTAGPYKTIVFKEQQRMAKRCG